LPLPKRIVQTVSEFLGSSGQHVAACDLRLCFEELISQIFEIVRVEQLSDEDLFDYCRYFTFCSKSTGNEALPEEAKGGHLFAKMIFSLGMGAFLALCQKAEGDKENKAG